MQSRELLGVDSEAVLRLVSAPSRAVEAFVRASLVRYQQFYITNSFAKGVS